MGDQRNWKIQPECRFFPNPDTHAHSYTNPDAHTHTYGNSHTHAYGNSHTHTYGNSHTHADTHTHATEYEHIPLAIRHQRQWRIDQDEALNAIVDYFNGLITKELVIAVIALYFSP